MSVQVRPVAPKFMQKLENKTYVFDLNLNTETIRESCVILHKFVTNYFEQDPIDDYNDKSTLSTRLFKNYNLLLYPLPGFHDLYWEIHKSFHIAISDLIGVTDCKYYITSWLNLYQKGDYIDWHHHYTNKIVPESEKNKIIWHGFYCVDTEPLSQTIYKSMITNKETVIESRNNRLVIGPAEDNFHKSTIWENDTKPRITIAFDIYSSLFFTKIARNIESYSDLDRVKRKDINKTLINRWIPI